MVDTLRSYHQNKSRALNCARLSKKRTYELNAYDEFGRAQGSTYIIGETAQSYGITYEDITGMVASYTTPQNSFTYSYDAFDRLTTKLGSMHSVQYTYVAGSQRVASYTISQATSQQTVYEYTYDQLGLPRAFLFRKMNFRHMLVALQSVMQRPSATHHMM